SSVRRVTLVIGNKYTHCNAPASPFFENCREFSPFRGLAADKSAHAGVRTMRRTAHQGTYFRTIPRSAAKAVSLVRRLWSVRPHNLSTKGATSARAMLRIIILIGPILAGDIERVRSPSPNS